MKFYGVAALAVALGMAGCQSETDGKPEGIILLVADGTSLELLTATRAYAVGAAGKLALDDLSHAATVRTYSRSHAVTDSSAAATAMARGVKADNLVVGMAGALDQGGPPSILDLAKKAGWSTGVISDDSVTGATPSAFLVEHSRRTQHALIAGKMIEQLGGRADLVLGGGARWFSSDDPQVVYPTGEREIVAETQERLAKLAVRKFTSWETFQNEVRSHPSEKPILGTFEADVFPFYADGARTLRLKDMVAEAVRIFQERKKPFLLVVEASLPDKASHLNNAKRAMVEVQECDAVIAWVRENLGDKVLLLVTTDHNTGGLAFNGYPPIGYKGDTLLKLNPLTDASILTWASGPGGKAETANIRTQVVRAPGEPLREAREAKLSTDADYEQPALIPRDSALHTGGDVWLYASGPGAERVRGSMNNTDIYQVMAKALPSQ